MNKENPKGCYLLLLRLPGAVEITFAGRTEHFPGGYYVYCGSAQGGLRGRLARHLGPTRSGHWHIDRLLEPCRVLDLQIRITRHREEECRLAGEVLQWPRARPVAGFGAGDCRCPTHLFYFPHRPLTSIRKDKLMPVLPAVYAYLRSRYDNHHRRQRDPFQTLAGCILSLRTQDPVTDAAMKRLFAVYPDVQSMCAADPERIASLIYPVGMYNRKARTLQQIAAMIIARHHGETPAAIEELVQLPGVGRKTANLVRSFAFHLPALCVDTHVHRITNRWGLVRSATPDQTEIELRRILPPEYWIETNALLVRHGQQLCRPIRPKCPDCGLQDFCLYPEVRQQEQLRQDIVITSAGNTLSPA